MDEAEEEIDRLEHSKKKLQRDLDEQQEANEQLQSQVKALKTEMRSTIQTSKENPHLKNALFKIGSFIRTSDVSSRRKSSSAPLLNTLHDDDDDDDDISTDGETYFSSTSGYKRSSSQENVLSTFTL